MKVPELVQLPATFIFAEEGAVRVPVIFILLNVVTLDPLTVVAPLNVVVLVFAVKVPEFAQFPASVIEFEPAISVALGSIVKLFATVIALESVVPTYDAGVKYRTITIPEPPDPPVCACVPPPPPPVFAVPETPALTPDAPPPPNPPAPPRPSGYPKPPPPPA